MYNFTESPIAYERNLLKYKFANNRTNLAGTEISEKIFSFLIRYRLIRNKKSNYYFCISKMYFCL